MQNALFRPIDAAILIYFRIFAGLLMAQELINGLILGKLEQYVGPSFHFSYLFFPWVKPWPYWGMVLHYSFTIFAGFAVAFNYHHRLFSKVLFIGLTLLFLFEQTEYINHSYLYCLLSFWIMLLPLNTRRPWAPAWMLYLILFHMGLAYFFGGIAKLNVDWLQGHPMEIFLTTRKNHFLSFLYLKSWAPLFFSYGGLLFDLLIVPLMIFPRTRLFGLLWAMIFHLSNVLMFGLATFPWFSLLMTTMFFDSSWPRKVPLLKRFMPWGVQKVPEYRSNRVLVTILGIYCGLHLLLPLRHHLYPGVTSWTEDAHMFSWRMMIRDKKGTLHLFMRKKNESQLSIIDPMVYVTERQFLDMIGHPDLILQFAHSLRDHFKKHQEFEIEVYASSRVSLNGRRMQEMIEPGVDLAREERSLLPYQWVRPLVR